MEKNSRDPITGEWDDPLRGYADDPPVNPIGAGDKPIEPIGHASDGARSGPRAGCADETGNDSVGYRRPPKRHQFSTGKSGNPKGRKKGAKNEATILNELLEQTIRIRVDGRIRTVTMRKAILMRFREEALKGDIKSAAFILNRQNQHASKEPEQTEMDQDDRAILEAYLKRETNSDRGPKG